MNDATRAAVRDLAKASFPEIYAPSPIPDLMGPVTPSLGVRREGPERKVFDTAIAEDAAFKKVFEGGDFGVFVTASTGAGWRLASSSLGEAVVGSAATRVLFRGGDITTSDRLVDESERVLQELDVLLGGGIVEVTFVLAFSGTIPEAEIQFPWGKAFAAPDYVARVRPLSELTPAMVLEIPIEVRFEVGEPDAGGAPSIDTAAAAAATRAGTLVPLAMLLGVERTYVAVEYLWQTTLLPGSAGWAFSGPAIRGSHLDRYIHAQALSVDECASVVRWAEDLEQHYDPSIDVAIRRVLAATRERTDNEAALIDAVIAMENLFGHGGETEVSFRVSSAIAVLLETDPLRRAAFRTKLGRVYRSRSQLVHGGIPNPARLHQHKEEAVSIAVQCLQVLVRDHPHLIPDKDRGIRLILRADSPT